MGGWWQSDSVQLKFLMVQLILVMMAAVLGAASPMVGDWKEAVGHDGKVRIPLQNPRGHSWFASIQMGTPKQYEQFCSLDNNHALSIVFPKNCASCPNGRLHGYRPSDSKTYMVRQKSEMLVQDDGFVVNGFMASDSTCIGMYGNSKQFHNPSTTVCMENQAFFLVDNQTDWDWHAKATDVKHVDAVCGLGKEKASMRAQGFLARAVHLDHLKHNVYSITLVPQELALPVANSPTLPEDRTEEQLMATSFLTLGGWDWNDYNGNITWFEADQSWNQTLQEFSLGGQKVVGESDRVEVAYEIGYPFIGLSDRYFDEVEKILSGVRGMECMRGTHWGICRVPDRKCDEVDLDFELNLKINDNEFTIPLKNIAVYVNNTGQYFCQTQLALLGGQSSNSVVLGSAFFTAFVGIFDVDNDRIGFAESKRALPGSKITCTSGCATPFEPHDHGSSGVSFGLILLIIGILLVATAAALGIYMCIKKRQSQNQSKKVDKRQKYKFIEDDDEMTHDDPNLSIGS